MRFKGQLLLPGESGPGLNVNLDVAEHHLAVESDGGGLGAWPLEVVDVERLQGDLFGLTVAGEGLRFVAEDTIGFAYSAVPTIERVGQKSRSRSGMRAMIGRLWNGSDAPDEPAAAPTAHVNEPTTVVEPSPIEDAPEAVDTRVQPQERHEIVIEEPVISTPTQAPVSLPPEPTVGQEVEPGSATQCPAVRSDGRHCESQILTDSGFCYPHDPRRAFEDGYEAAQEARAQLKQDATGRLNRIYGRLEKAMRQVERGELAPDTAMAMAQLARTMCAILEMDEPTGDTGTKPAQM